MKNSHKQIKVTLSETLHQLVQQRADELGISIAGYLRTLAVSDLRGGGMIVPEETTGKMLPVRNGGVAGGGQPPQVIVVNTGTAGGRMAKSEGWRMGRERERSERRHLSLNEVLEMI